MEEKKPPSDSISASEEMSQDEPTKTNTSPEIEKNKDVDLEGELKKLIEQNELQAEAFKKMIKGLQIKRNPKNE
jgi:hypothetical protein